MRKLLWFSLGFSAACGLSIYVMPMPWTAWLGVLFAVAAIVLFGLSVRGRVRIVAVICLGLAVGQLWYTGYDAIYLAPIREMDGQTVQLSVNATEFSAEGSYGILVKGRTTVAGRYCRIQICLNDTQQVLPGEQITGYFRLRYTAPGGEKDATYHSGNGILLLGYSRGAETVISGQTPSWWYGAAYLRQALQEKIEQIFPADTGGFVKALLLGDTTGLDYATDTALSISGIRHVAAVSGLHVSILFSLVYFISGKRRLLTTLLGIPALVLFAAMAGFSPSILRAGIMQLLMLLALAFKQEYDPPTALSFAVLAMLAANPLMITSVGFQLSVGSVAGIFLFAGRISSWLLDGKRLGRWKPKSRRGRLARWFSTSIAISLSAYIATTPLAAWYFGNISLFGLVTNLLCLWVITFLFCGIIAACMLSVIWLPLGNIAAWLLSWLVRYILAVARLIAAIPLAAVYTQSLYIIIWLVFCYILLTVFLLSKEKQPVVLVCCTVLSLCVALLASWVEPLLDDYRVTVLDVGQGQCILLQSQGRTYMVDCGSDYEEDSADIAAAALLSQGITRLDGLILSHYDKDHVGGAAYLLGRIPADVLILPVGEHAEVWEPEIIEAFRGTPIYADEDLKISWGNVLITVFSSQDTKTSNESSLCVLFHTEKCDILITGDRSKVGEAELLTTLALPKLDALIVGHHGAGTSTGELLLQATRPMLAIISVGQGNPYGHPATEVLERLQAYGCRIKRTDIDGTIIIRG